MLQKHGQDDGEYECGQHQLKASISLVLFKSREGNTNKNKVLKVVNPINV